MKSKKTWVESVENIRIRLSHELFNYAVSTSEVQENQMACEKS
jgi:hypothetical protein